MASKKSARGLLKKKRKTARSKSVKKSKKKLAQLRRLKNELKKVKRELARAKAAKTREKHLRERRIAMRKVWEIELRARREARRAVVRIAKEKALLQKIEQTKQREREKVEPKVHMVEMDLDTPNIVLGNVVQKLKAFNAKMGFESTVDGSVQSDLSVVIETQYTEMGRLEEILNYLSEEIQSYGPQFKICIDPLFDVSKMIGEIERIDFDKVKIGGNPYNLYKGRTSLPMNVTQDVVGAFANFQYDLLPRMIEFMGTPPEILRVLLLWGDTIMAGKTSRDWATDEDREKETEYW